ncbi:polysaccharide biosynthesis tyrosine autokinase [Piscinibacter gummiphilus]|uniref:Polysaccharide biosynthesis tyrosine autokinase n=1 Tax=Piscinibacter gummiphilus TaxID=946333 RepID=A0ABZ0CPV7_9BURK|nr:polysaccharide biosynthesis tyrosine autokinase [Piscinibacter gummiphilus]WOB07008.1 polysaccharide biosynthesis tyrosine autokinase [Piscinibacter gummiphilus]
MRIEARTEEPRFDASESIWGAEADVVVTDRPIGSILTETKRLPAGQIDKVLEYQRRKGIRFGEAAVALKLITEDDVLYALSQQFHYPYAPHTRRDLSGELVAAMQPFSDQAEAFRALRSQLMMRMFMPGAAPRALAIVSPEKGDGKTFFAANLAIAMAQLGGRTLLIDANLRGPRIHQLFSIEEKAGLSGVLSGRVQANVIHQIADLNTLFVLPVGVAPPNPLELVERPAFSRLLSELLGKFDHVIVDTPASQRGSDAGVIAARCGAALVVARRHQSRLGALHQLVSRLKDSPAQLAGVVINEY